MEDTKFNSHRRDVHQQAEHPVASSDVYDQYGEKVVFPKGDGTDNTTFDNSLSDSLRKDDKANIMDAGIEREYDRVEVPAWRDQLTPRALLVSLFLGVIFSVITHRLSLTVGVIPSLNVSAGLLGFLFIRIYTFVAEKLGFHVKPFTRQENTVIQTCVVACYGLAFSGGFGSYLLGMSNIAYDKMGDVPGNTLDTVKNPSLSWMIPYTLVIALLGIFVLVPLRKVMIIDYKLTYPSGTATAVLINSFHTPAGAALARKQVIYLSKYFSFSFGWSFFKWFFSGIDCGFDTFPSLGLKAYSNKFLFDFNMTYVGAGMICPHIVNCSILFGAIVSWGLMWPLIQNNAGSWYPADATGSNFRGIFGYKVFISIALILGDGLYHFVRVTIISLRGIYVAHNARLQLPVTGEKDDIVSHDERRRNEVFMKDGVPYWVALTGYLGFAVIAIIVIPFIFPPVKWYFVVVAYTIGPVFAFCNAYGAGLTDWNMASNYGKIFLFIFATWAGSHGGILAGLAACGVAMTIVASASDLMQDFKTGYLTLSSPRSMFVSQLIGGVMGVFIAPTTFWMFYKAFDIGAPGSPYQAPYALIYRTMALVGVEGFGSLPKHCLQLCAGWFAFAIVVNFIRDSVPKKYSQFIPIPMAMAIPFYLGAYFAVDMFVGTCIVFIWQRTNRRKADTFTAAIASGLICGDGIWTIPMAILNFAKINPPICMTFFPTKVAQNLGYPLT